MTALTRDLLLASDREVKEVQVPEWGGTVYVRSLTLAELLALEEQVGAVQDDGPLAIAYQLAAFICDASGEPLFTVADVPALVAKRGTAATRIVKAGTEMNRVFDVEAAKGN